MEQQSDGFRCRAVFQPMDTDRLTRSETHDRFVVEIVDRLSVVDNATCRLFEEQRIKSQRHPMRRLRHRTVEMHDADQRVACLEPEKTVILLDGVRFDYIFRIHNSINAFLSYPYFQYKGNTFSPIIKAS